MQNTTKATIRTTINTTELGLIVFLLNRFFSWNLTLDDLLPFTPLIGIVVAMFYRVCLVLTEIFPVLGFVLFGYPTTPEYPVKDAA
jgi:hypothetical protein